MRFHKEGYTSMALCLLFILVTNALLDYYFSDIKILIWFWYVLSFVLFIIILQFFRSPSRNWVIDENSIICPADGKVVVIEETEENEYLNKRCIQVSVFMSPLNVHINRNPIAGIVKYFKYHPGKYLVAWHPKSSTENERTTTVVQHKNGVEILFRQIAGALARRIVWYINEGDQVEQTEEFGFIKFGSRVDIFLPIDCTINVQIGELVKGGITSIANFK